MPYFNDVIIDDNDGVSYMSNVIVHDSDVIADDSDVIACFA